LQPRPEKGEARKGWARKGCQEPFLRKTVLSPSQNEKRVPTAFLLCKLGLKAAIDIGLGSGDAVGDYRATLGLRGLMDAVRIYDGALTAEQIQQHAADPGETDSGITLALHYSFVPSARVLGKFAPTYAAQIP